MATVTREREALQAWVRQQARHARRVAEGLRESALSDTRVSADDDDRMAARWDAYAARFDEIAAALAAPPDEDENARTVRSLARMLGWENVPPRETLERDVAALKARAQAPPASDPPGLEHQEIVVLIDKAHDELSAMCRRQWNREPAIKWAIPARPGIDSDLVIGEALSAARKLTARQSDPPGLVALVDKHIDGLRRAYSHEGIGVAMRELGKIRIEALEGFRDTLLPASPQAETTKGDK